MTRRICMVALVLLALAGSTVLYAQVNCSIDKSSAYFTGKTQTDKATGKLLYQYKCTRNHVFWIAK